MSEHTIPRKRRYQLKRRAETQADTHRRIVEATVRFHRTIGPSRTTVAAICRAAGIQRATFYRHFPDEHSLFAACRELAMRQDPVPDLEAFGGIADPILRLHSALAAAYAYYRANEQAMAVLLRDAEILPVGRPFLRFRDDLRDLLAAAWPAGGDRWASIRAACGQAADFQVWRSLASNPDLTDAQVVDVMVGMVRAAAGEC